MKVRALDIKQLILGLSFGATIAAFVIGIGGPRLQGLEIDLLVWLRHIARGSVVDRAPSPTVIIALDEETYRRAPFRGVPDALWTAQMGRVLSTVLDADPSVVGLDVIYSTTADTIRPGYDSDLLRAIAMGAAKARVVLGRVQHQRFPINPHPSQVLVAGGMGNVRALNLIEDPDGIVRRVPAAFTRQAADGTLESERSMAFELAARALQPSSSHSFQADARADTSDDIILNFDTMPGAIPIYSLADLYACAEHADLEYFQRQFAGKIVLIGGVLDVEDRKLTSMRFATTPEGRALPPRCRFPIMSELYSDAARDTIPGVQILATAVNNILRRDGLKVMAPPLATLLIVIVGVASSIVPLYLTPVRAGIVLALIASALTMSAFIIFRSDVVIPWLSGLATIGCTAPGMFGFRVGVIDRQRRQILEAFGLYLPRPEVERLAAAKQLPVLGGEVREISVLFADIADFTRYSEELAPETLVSELNAYFAHAGEIIERHGGFIDKFLGDAFIAVFGAPVAKNDHVQRAAKAAIAIDRELSVEDGRPTLAGHPIRVRVGVSTGTALVGNIGAARRFNYTVIGDTVNLASRIEGANKFYGTRVLMSGDVARGAECPLRLVDRVVVRGRQRPVDLWTTISDPGLDLPACNRAHALWTSGQFAEASSMFETLAAAGDPVSAAFAYRCREYLSNPPHTWDGVTHLNEK